MSVLDLWLPILLAGLATHFASVAAWMVLSHHKPEWKGLDAGVGGAEDGLLDLLDEKKVPPGQYLFPHYDDYKEQATPEFKQKMETRCRGMLLLWPSPPNMGKAIALTFSFFMVAALVIGYLASIAFAPGASKEEVFRLVFVAGLLCHCAGPFPGVFWFRKYFAMELLDGLAYAAITAGLFAWLWPAA